MSSKTSTIQDRLSAVQQAIAKATGEASQQQDISMSGGSLGGVRIKENDEPNASYHLGMELFGQEAAVIERNVQTKLTQVEKELDGVLKAMKDEEPLGDEEVNQLPDVPILTPQELEAQGEQLRAQILFLKECSKIRVILDESISQVSNDLESSAELLCQAKEMFEKVMAQQEPGRVLEETKSQVFSISESIRNALRRQKVDILRRSKSLWHSCVELTQNSLAVRGPATGSFASTGSKNERGGVAVAYGALEVLSRHKEKHAQSPLEDILHGFVKDLYNTVLAKVLEDHSQGLGGGKWIFRETEEQNTATTGLSVVTTTSMKCTGPLRRLEWTKDQNDSQVNTGSHARLDTDGVTAWKETFSFFQKLFSFVADRLLLRKQSLCSLVGKRLFGKPNGQPSMLNLDALNLESCRLGHDNGMLMEPLVDCLTSSCVPSYLAPDELHHLDSDSKRLRSYIEPFLLELEACGLQVKTPDSRLEIFLGSFEQNYVDKRHCAILNEARRILTKTDYHNTVVVGVDAVKTEDGSVDPVEEGLSVFKLHRCSISQTASSIMTLCRKTMDEAVAQEIPPEESPLCVLPATLYRSARESLDLFRAMIPVAYGYEISNVPRTAAIFHNDSVFLAHHCLTLGLEYRNKFRSSDSENARVKLLASACVFVDMVPLFRDLADRSLGDMLDLQAKQLADIVAERIPLLGDSLRSDEILAEWTEAETALTAAIYHLRHIFQAWEQILSRDILAKSMWYLADVVLSLFLEQVIMAKDISTSACQFVSNLFQQAAHEIRVLIGGDTTGSRVWDRFSAVGRFMDMSLSDIQVALTDGLFRNVTASELECLIVATFDESPKRRGLLDILAKS